jgi:hypothetical protein
MDREEKVTADLVLDLIWGLRFDLGSDLSISN